MIYHSISDYLIARYEWEKIPLRMSNGKFYSYVNGDWIEGVDWDKPRYEHFNKDNPDKSNINVGVIPHKTR